MKSKRTTLLKIVILVLIAVVMSEQLAWAEPNIPEKEVTCDVAGLDQMYEDLTNDVCYSGTFASSMCVGYNSKAAVENAVFTLGLGLVKGALLAVASGFELKEAAYEKLDEGQKATQRFLNNVKGIKCDETMENKYMVLRIDEKIREKSATGPGDEHPDAPDKPERPDKPTDPKKMVQYNSEMEKYKAEMATYKAEIERLDRDPKWWCEPVVEPGTKLYRFLDLPEEKQRKLLCQSPKLRDYYRKVMASKIRELSRGSKITGLKCDMGDKTSGARSALQFVVDKNGQKTKFDLKLFDDGSAEQVKTSLVNPEDAVAYKNWKKHQDMPKNSCRSNKADTFVLNGKQVDLKPGQFEFMMKKVGTSSALKEVHLINATIGLCKEYMASSIPGDRYEEVKKVWRSYPDADLPAMQDAYNLFLLRGQAATSCCRELDTKKKSECLKQLDSDGLTPPSTTAVVQPPPKKSQKTKAHR